MAAAGNLPPGHSWVGTLKALGMLRESRGAKDSLDGAPTWLSTVGLAVVVGIAYFMAARLGLTLRATTGISVFWPAAGISVAALIVCGASARFPVAVGVVVATVISHLMTGGRSTGLVVVFAVVNAGQALFTAGLIERWFGRSFKLGSVSQVLGFLLATTLGSAVAATGAVVATALFEPTIPVLTFWRVWFGSCLLGIIAVAPMLVGIAEAVRQIPPRGELLEGIAGLSLLGALSTIAIALPEGPWSTALPLAIVFPVLLCIAVRCRPAFGAGSAFIVAATVVGSINFGIGHFGDPTIPLADRVLAAQTIVLTGVVLSLVLAALFAERRRIEFVLERSNRRLQLALDGAELGAFSADLTTGRLECDARAAFIHGHKLPATTLSESRRFVHPDDLGRVDAALSQAWHAGGIWTAEYRVVHPPGHQHAGETRWVAVEGSIMRDPESTEVGLLGVTHDITERKLAQQGAQRLASIVESSEDAIISKDPNGIVLSWNQGAERLFGYSAEDVIGKSILLVIPQDREHEELAILERIRLGERLIQYETVRRCKDGTLIDISLTVSPLRDEAGAIVGASKIARDISARKRAEEHQCALNAELDHRVKNVLATVCAIVDQTREASTTYTDFLAGLDRRIRSLASTHDLLSRGHWHGVSLTEIARREFAPYARGNTVIRGPNIALKADATSAVAMVLHELTTNAVKYGALSNADGRVNLRWRWKRNGGPPRLVIDWKEIGGPPVVRPNQSGYGTCVVREVIPFELGGAVDLAFDGDGLRCRLEIPADWITTGSPSKRFQESDTAIARVNN
jgi:PAS domain S-box-containing protein